MNAIWLENLMGEKKDLEFMCKQKAKWLSLAYRWEYDVLIFLSI